jgi:alpha-ketoglutarate-dependent taurine dioxygenase
VQGSLDSNGSVTSPLTVTSEPADTWTLEQHGFLLYRLETNTHDAVCDATRALARSLGRSVDLVTLDSSGDPRALPVHTEGVYRSVPPRYFMLGCVNPSATGGNTIIYDARTAARLIRRERPELADVSIVYASKAHGIAAEHRLVETRRTANGSVPVLVFRDRTESNRLPTVPPGWSEEALYTYVRDAVGRSVVIDHPWRAGDILVVDNHVTLHARSAFMGTRRLVRLRIDDGETT